MVAGSSFSTDLTAMGIVAAMEPVGASEWGKDAFFSVASVQLVRVELVLAIISYSRRSSKLED
jgi:hypothetical protein